MSRRGLLGILGFQNLGDLSAQNRSVVYYSLPDERPIDTEVFMNKDVSQPHYVRPRHRAVPRRDLRAEPRDRFR